MQINWSVRTTVTDKSPFIDSVKIRLLSPFTKATETCNDKNVAIGKCRGLSRTLEYFEIRNIKRTVIDRMVYRFRDFIKGPHRLIIYAVESLPTALGGLGLGLDYRYLVNLPRCFNKAIRAISKGGSPGYRARTELGRIFANTVPRGVTGVEFINGFMDQILDYPDSVETMSRTDALNVVDPNRVNTYAHNLWLLAKQDIVPLGNLQQVAERPFLFRKLLEQVGTGKSYRTETTARRISKCWTNLENFEFDTSDDVLTEDELNEAVRTSKMVGFVNLNLMTSIAIADTANESYSPEDPWLAADFKDVSLKEFLTYGEPSMKVQLREIFG
jgi:hypothetical protein